MLKAAPPLPPRSETVASSRRARFRGMLPQGRPQDAPPQQPIPGLKSHRVWAGGPTDQPIFAFPIGAAAGVGHFGDFSEVTNSSEGGAHTLPVRLHRALCCGGWTPHTQCTCKVSGQGHMHTVCTSNFLTMREWYLSVSIPYLRI
jgi:hypothetical protein